ncbi:plasmid partition protein ParG [Enterobacter roggenkampii]|uniref:Plasmid partitioning protein n=1 Tax=Enterobacter roggenkampii TaxID=1812935 RepID=A0A7I8HSW7_9ENTR|nr:plasmid partition protein ParG [Enterobacter roggenkampii]BCM64622.1 plasmid partitioning protein [Enterobacter roggenkampii]
MSTSTKGALSAGRPSAKSNKAATLASLADKSATSRVNFDLDRDQHTKLKVYAAKQGKTVKEVLTELVAQLPE